MVQEVFSLAPDVIVLPHARRKWDSGFFRRFFKAGIRVVVLDTEGAVEDQRWLQQSLIQDTAVRDRIGAYLCWGSRVSSALIGAGLFREDQVRITGCPRMDYYAPPWRDTALRMTDKDAAGLTDFVLFNCNFVIANPRPSIADALRREIATFDDPKLSGTYEQRKSANSEALNGMIDLANELSSRFPEQDFVVRPHPYEGLGVYRERLQPRPNLHLRAEGTVDGWLLRAKAMIHRNCSTAVEASFMAVPALAPKWLPADATVPMSDACSIHFERSDELTRSLQGILEGRFEAPVRIRESVERITSELFYRNDGEAHRRVADVLCEPVYRRSRKRHLEACRRIFQRRIAHGSPREGRVRRALNRLVGSPAARPGTVMVEGAREVQDSFRQGDTYFDEGDVATLLAEIQKSASGSFDGVRTARADGRGAYHFGYALGESIAVFPADGAES